MSHHREDVEVCRLASESIVEGAQLLTPLLLDCDLRKDLFGNIRKAHSLLVEAKVLLDVVTDL